MHSQRWPVTRRLTVRPLRPPSGIHLTLTVRNRRLSAPRPFTQKSSLLLVKYHTPRPQLPFLTQPALQRQQQPFLNKQVARLLSTDTKRYVKQQVWIATKWTVILWIFVGLGTVAVAGVSIEIQEREQPTPAEWSLLTRHFVRVARQVKSEVQVNKAGYVYWPRVGEHYLAALKRLEDVGADGSGLKYSAEGQENPGIEGVGSAGFDISDKSWPWRSGYYECIMGCAEAAEHLDSTVLDKKRSMEFPKATVIGPSNADPRPTPSYMNSAPREEDCVPFYDPPEQFYMRILTGKGFTTDQRVKAARACANWFEFKGLLESAEEMYRWELDIAKSGLRVPPENVMDTETSVLKQGVAASEITINLLAALTDLAVYYASSGRATQALPTLLSVLRARRESPVAAPVSTATPAPKTSRILEMFGKFLSPPTFPPPPPSGDLPFFRSTNKSTCAESELMLYVSEILFVTPSTSIEGLAWTRQAIDVADSNLDRATAPISNNNADDSELNKCRECLLAGASNWQAMINQLESRKRTSTTSSWSSWAMSSASGQGSTDLEEEQRSVNALKERITYEGIEEQVARATSSNRNGIWMG